MIIQNINKLGEDAVVEMVQDNPVIIQPQQIVRVPDDHKIVNDCVKKVPRLSAARYERMKTGKNRYRRGNLIQAKQLTANK